LSQLLAYDGNVEEIYCRTFQIEYESAFGEILKYDLVENGDKIAVTNQNRAEFVDLYVDWLINKSVENQFGYFKKGFEIIDGLPVKKDADFENIEFDTTQPLEIEQSHFADCIKNNITPRTDGENAIEVLETLERAQKDMIK